MGKAIKINKKRESSGFSRLLSKRYFYHTLIFIFSFSLYAGTVLHGYNLDDGLVTNNHKLTSLGISGIPQIFTSSYYSDEMGYAFDYRPVTLTTFAIEHQFFGDNAHVSHLINVILYSLLCVIIFVTLKKLLPDFGLLLFFVCLLFAAHPVHTEVVCSIKNRDEILALLFSFLSLLVVLKTYQTKWFLGVVTAGSLFTIALLSKVTVLSMAFIIPLSIIVFMEAKLKKVIILAVFLLIPALLLADIDILIYKILLLFVPVAGLVFIQFFKTEKQTGVAYFKNMLQRLSRAARISRNHSLQPKLPPPTVSPSVSTRPLLFRSFFTVKILPWLFLLFSSAAFAFTCYGLFFDDFIWVYAGIFLTIAGIYYYQGRVWYFNVVISFLIAILLIEKYDQPFNYINGVINILLLFLLFFGPKNKRLFWGVLYAFFIVHHVYICHQSLMDVILPALLFYSIIDKRFLKLGYFLFAVGLFTAANAVRLFLVSNNIGFIESMPFEFIFLGSAFLLKSRNKEHTVFIGFFLLYVPIAFYVEANYKALLPYKNLSRTEEFTYYKVYNSPLRFQIEQQIQDKKNAIILNWNRAVHSTKYTSQEIIQSTKYKATEVKQNIIEANQIAKTALTYQVKKITPVEEDRPLSYAETPIRVSDPVQHKIASSFDVLLRYLKLAFLPYPLSFYYGYKVVSPAQISNPEVILSIFLYGLMVCAIVYFLWTRKFVFFFSIVLYMGMIIPFSNVWSIPGIMAERYLFGASLGICIFLGLIMSFLLKVDIRSSLSDLKIGTKYLALALLMLYSVVTFSRTLLWKDELTLMSHDIKYVSQSAQAHNLFAFALMKESTKQPDRAKQTALKSEALLHFKKALNIYPGFFNVAFDIGRVYADLNMPDSALAYYIKATQLDSTFSTSYQYVAELLMAAKRYDEAIPYVRHLIRAEPAEYEAYAKLAFIYFNKGEYGKSIDVNKKAMSQIPLAVIPVINIARTFAVMNQPDSSFYYHQKVLQLDPNNPISKQAILDKAVGKPVNDMIK